MKVLEGFKGAIRPVRPVAPFIPWVAVLWKRCFRLRRRGATAAVDMLRRC